MEVIISNTKTELGKKAACAGAELIKKAIQQNGEANIIVATGASQFEMLRDLIQQDIDWTKVTAFHLDEYIGLSDDHPASFRKYLKERFASKVPLKKFNYVNGDKEPYEECKRLEALISQKSTDVAFVGIGENGHLAFNDPPADFESERAYLVVKLDKECRLQQMGEGWFSTLEDVPETAISMSVKQIMKSKAIICSVPDERKAKAVKGTMEGKVSPLVPASVLMKHSATKFFLDKESASLLE